MKHIIYGGFDYAVKYEMNQDAIYQGIDYFIDDNTDLIGTTYLGKQIKHPKTLLKEKKGDIIILIGSIVYRTELAFRLRDMGFEEGKDFIWAIEFTGDKECQRLWYHIEWSDTVDNSDNIKIMETSEYNLNRIKVACRLIEWNKIHTLIDLGAANERIREFIPTNIKYIPVDYIKYSHHTVLCDFNKYEFPTNPFDIKGTCVVSIGNIQYCKDWKWYLEKIVEACDCLILGHNDFVRISREYRRTHWLRYNSLFDYEIIIYMLKLGFQLTDAVDFRLKTTLYKFEKKEK